MQFFSLRVGPQPGIYTDVQKLMEAGYDGAVVPSFPTYEEALAFYHGHMSLRSPTHKYNIRMQRVYIPLYTRPADQPRPEKLTTPDMISCPPASYSPRAAVTTYSSVVTSYSPRAEAVSYSPRGEATYSNVITSQSPRTETATYSNAITSHSPRAETVTYSNAITSHSPRTEISHSPYAGGAIQSPRVENVIPRTPSPKRKTLRITATDKGAKITDDDGIDIVERYRYLFGDLLLKTETDNEKSVTSIVASLHSLDIFISAIVAAVRVTKYITEYTGVVADFDMMARLTELYKTPSNQSLKGERTKLIVEELHFYRESVMKENSQKEKIIITD